MFVLGVCPYLFKFSFVSFASLRDDCTEENKTEAQIIVIMLLSSQLKFLFFFASFPFHFRDEKLFFSISYKKCYVTTIDFPFFFSSLCFRCIRRRTPLRPGTHPASKKTLLWKGILNGKQKERKGSQIASRSSLERENGGFVGENGECKFRNNSISVLSFFSSVHFLLTISFTMQSYLSSSHIVNQEGFSYAEDYYWPSSCCSKAHWNDWSRSNWGWQL